MKFNPNRLFKKNPVRMSRLFSCCLFLFLALLVSPPVTAQEESIGLINSARANGMGSCVSTLVDPHAAFYNPGALGVFYLDNSLGLTLPSGISLAPSRGWANTGRPDTQQNQNQVKIGGIVFDLPDNSLQTWSLGYGVSKTLRENQNGESLKIGVGAAYSSIIFNLKSFANSSVFGSKREAVSGYTFSFGMQYYLRVGFGVTKKMIKHNSSSDSYFSMDEEIAQAPLSSNESNFDADDNIGVLFSLPVQSLFKKGIIVHNSSGKNWKLNIIPSVAYFRTTAKESYYKGVSSRTGEDIKKNAYAKNSRLGVSLETELVVGPKHIISVLFAHEREKLTKRQYSLPSGSEYNKWGIEIGAVETVYARFGRIDNHITTFGLGLYPMKALNSFLRSDLFQNIDLSLDYARWSSPGNSSDNSSFFKTTIVFNP